MKKLQIGFYTLLLLVIAACFCWGIDNHLTALVDGASPQTITFIKGIFAGTCNFAAVQLFEASVQFS